VSQADRRPDSVHRPDGGAARDEHEAQVHGDILKSWSEQLSGINAAAAILHVACAHAGHI
jgi:hypothetical protein